MSQEFQRYRELLQTYFWPQRVQVGLLIGLILLDNALQLLGPNLLSRFVDLAVNTTTSAELQTLAGVYLITMLCRQGARMAATYVGETAGWRPGAGRTAERWPPGHHPNAGPPPPPPPAPHCAPPGSPPPRQGATHRRACAGRGPRARPPLRRSALPPWPPSPSTPRTLLQSSGVCRRSHSRAPGVEPATAPPATSQSHELKIPTVRLPVDCRLSPKRFEQVCAAIPKAAPWPEEVSKSLQRTAHLLRCCASVDMAPINNAQACDVWEIVRTSTIC